MDEFQLRRTVKRIMKTWTKTAVIAALVGEMAYAVFAATNSTISSTSSNKWAWSSSVGWINCKSDVTNGVVIGQYVCSGFMYSPTAGWISLGNGNPSNGIQYATNSATDYGVNHDGQGHLWGYAWCPSAGWINFGWTNATDPQAPKVDLQTGFLSGYAWGTGVGWISLSNLSTRVKTDTIFQGNCSNTNGIPDAWALTYFGTTNVNFSIDTDTDGVVNADEYVAGTNPTNQNDYLGINDVTISGTNIQFTWSSTQMRNYRIDMKTNLMDAVWADSGLGTILADASSNTIRSILASTQGFFRVTAVVPLQ